MLIPLPIDNVIPQIIEELGGGNNLVLTAAPGAGKTTRVGPAIVKAGIVKGSVVMLQPRRVAARSGAQRIAKEQGWTLGEEVGYQVRFENRTGPRTKLKVVTEGILTQIIRNDPFLEGIDCVILDEFHERSVHSDLAIAMCREIQQSVRPDLKILVMSATMDAARVAEFLGGAKVFHAAGRVFPVEKHYMPGNEMAGIAERTLEVLEKVIHTRNRSLSGHVLCFLPGMKEIRRVADTIKLLADDEVHILHSSVTSEDQDRALTPSAKRKIILATNIAETSITIDDVGTVVDSGWTRGVVWNEKLGLPRLETMRESKASMVQRAGRAGRTRPGECYKVWSVREEQTFPDYDVPEIHRSDLSQYVLLLTDYGINDPMQFCWYEAPSVERLRKVLKGLRLLGLLGDHGLTELGKAAAGLPLPPNLSVLLLAGKSLGVEREAAIMAAVLQEWDQIARGADAVADIVHYIWDNFIAKKGGEYVVERAASQLLKYSQSAKVVHQFSEKLINLPKEDILRYAMILAFPDRIAKLRTSDKSKAVMVGGNGVRFTAPVTSESGLVVCVHLRDAENFPEPTVSAWMPVSLRQIEDVFPQYFGTGKTAVYDEDRGKVLVRNNRVFLDIVLSYHEQGPTANDEDVVAEAIRDNLLKRFVSPVEILCKSESVDALLSRYYYVYHRGEASLPALDFHEILASACLGVPSPDKVFGDDLIHKVTVFLDYSAMKTVDALAPGYFVNGKGKRFAIRYPSISEPHNLRGEYSGPPVLSAKIQELFGVKETPAILNGKVKLLVHLLGPNFRPVQVTGDLEGFWKNTYGEVRKELRARYPKHAWPENPFEFVSDEKKR